MALHVWTNGTDTVIAEDRNDALRVMQEHTGDPCEEYDRDDWRVHPDDKVLPIRYEEGELDLPPGTKPVVTRTCAEWIAANKRGFLCTTEW